MTAEHGFSQPLPETHQPTQPLLASQVTRSLGLNEFWAVSLQRVPGSSNLRHAASSPAHVSRGLLISTTPEAPKGRQQALLPPCGHVAHCCRVWLSEAQILVVFFLLTICTTMPGAPVPGSRPWEKSPRGVLPVWSRSPIRRGGLPQPAGHKKTPSEMGWSDGGLKGCSSGLSDMRIVLKGCSFQQYGESEHRPACKALRHLDACMGRDGAVACSSRAQRLLERLPQTS